MKLTAIKNNGLIIQYINNLTEKVQLTAVKNNGLAIQYIHKPSEKIQLTALKNNKASIKHIRNPTLKVRLLAYKKVTIPMKKPKFKLTDTNIIIETINGELKITNNTKQFLKLISLAEYKGKDIFNIPNFSIPPEGVKTVYTASSNDIEIYSLKDKITFGYALEYQVGNNKTKNLYKTKKYSISDIQ